MFPPNTGIPSLSRYAQRKDEMATTQKYISFPSLLSGSIDSYSTGQPDLTWEAFNCTPPPLLRDSHFSIPLMQTSPDLSIRIPSLLQCLPRRTPPTAFAYKFVRKPGLGYLRKRTLRLPQLTIEYGEGRLENIQDLPVALSIPQHIWHYQQRKKTSSQMV